MTIIQQGVHDSLFSRIAAAEIAKQTWEILQLEFQGDSQVQSVKLQGLQRAFENLNMKEDEVFGDYFLRVMNNIGQQRSYGEEIGDQKIVEKILKSLSPRFYYVIPSIEVTFDIADMAPCKIKSKNLLRETRTGEDVAVALQEEEGQANVAENDAREEQIDAEDQHLLMISTGDNNNNRFKTWFMVSEASNHMTSNLESFIDMNETFKLNVKLGDNKPVKVEGKGTVILVVSDTNFKLLENV
ncbi:uncharacterized protein LOC143598710 [Bidens hawaiensis]|uniref:uncharacterized protein LOC143598710 n=1 Tax=Bidens hawaiensis TaxID=980011 RepID=UPI00404984A7